MWLTSIPSTVGVSRLELAWSPTGHTPGALARETTNRAKLTFAVAAVARGWKLLRNFRYVLKYMRCDACKWEHPHWYQFSHLSIRKIQWRNIFFKFIITETSVWNCGHFTKTVTCQWILAKNILLSTGHDIQFTVFIAAVICIILYMYICVCICICIYVYVCVYVYICIYICIWICIYVYVYVYVYEYMCMYMYIYVYVYEYMCMYIYICIWICICIRICIYVYVYVYVYMYIYMYMNMYICVCTRICICINIVRVSSMC